jgi:hypothetical protein
MASNSSRLRGARSGSWGWTETGAPAKQSATAPANTNADVIDLGFSDLAFNDLTLIDPTFNDLAFINLTFIVFPLELTCTHDARSGGSFGSVMS